MASYLITGASRGLGLAFARQLASLPATEVSKVFATARGDAPSALTELAKKSPNVVVLKLDVTDEASILQAASEVEKKLEGKGLDVLINNAAISSSLSGVEAMNDLMESVQVNVLGVHWVTRAFLPLLQRGVKKQVANISTTFGSIGLAGEWKNAPLPAYKISKAAMNALTVQYALEYEEKGFTFVALCPGWMKTELGGIDRADLTPEVGAKASLEVLSKPREELNGKFPKVFVKGFENKEGVNRYDGTEAPW